MLSRARKFIAFCGLLITLIINSGEALQCYQCKSHARADDACRGDIITKKGETHLINCSISTMSAWHDDINEDHSLHRIAQVFAVDPGVSNKDYKTFVAMACAKIELKVDNEHMTLRTCQTPKTSLMDPCEIIDSRLKKDYANSITVEYCGLCEKDNCNGTGIKSATYIGTFLSMLVTVLMGHVRAV